MKYVFVTLILAIAAWVLFMTGPQDLTIYPSQEEAVYLLPWEAEKGRFVSQGNRSFTTHRGHYYYSWDFWMSRGTEILAARGGVVTGLLESVEGIGWYEGNFVMITHEDGTHAVYAHLEAGGALVEIGDQVKQGQVIGYAGMTGKTINPHLHFHVLNPGKSASIPIAFNDVPGGVPFAGRWYVSGNSAR